MLHIVLVILKIIGILLAVILGLILLFLFAILFCPFRYKFRICYEQKTEVNGIVSFLGPLIRLKIIYGKELYIRLRILGIPIGRRHKNVSDKEADEEEQEIPTYPQEKELTDHTDDSVGIQAELPDDKEIKDSLPPHGEKTKAETEHSGIRGFGHKSKKKAQNIKKSAARTKQFIASIWKLREDERIRRALAKVKNELIRLAGRMKPGQIKGYVEFGFEDPSITGKILGIAAIAKSIWSTKVQVIPNFEQKILHTQLLIKGRIKGIWMLRTAWTLYFNKDIKYMIKCAKRLRRK